VGNAEHGEAPGPLWAVVPWQGVGREATNSSYYVVLNVNTIQQLQLVY
jgi:hypothetical protein